MDYIHQYLDILHELGYKSTITIPTRVFGNAQSCIDHIFLRSRVGCVTCTSIVYDSNITDHFAVINSLLIDKNETKCINPNSKFWTRINYKKVINDLNQVDFENNIIGKELEDATNWFLQTIKLVIG